MAYSLPERPDLGQLRDAGGANADRRVRAFVRTPQADPSRERGMAEVVRLLLAAGASPDTNVAAVPAAAPR